MTVGMLQAEVDASTAQLETVAAESLAAAREGVEIALSGMSPADLEAQSSSTGAVPPRPAGASAGGGLEIEASSVTRDVASIQRINLARSDVYRLSSARHLVEIHKKYAISVACIIFILLGPPLAMRFPQGGVGMVIAVSVGIFFIYWVGLIGGERFADEGQVDPVLAMWASNAVLTLVAVFFLWNVADRISTNRGSVWSELINRLGVAMDRRLRGSTPRVAAEEGT